jgi:peptidyl-Lys metalloendopeptidase
MKFVPGPESVNGVENLKVVATVTNTGDQTLKVLNDPRGPLSTLPANTFDITDSAGARPAFTGIRVKYSPEAAAAAGAFTTLAPGQSVVVEHNRRQTIVELSQDTNIMAFLSVRGI